MTTTTVTTVNPADVIGPEGLLDSLLSGVEFSTFPVEMIGIALGRASRILTVMQSGATEDQDTPHLADAAQSQVDAALSLVLAWHRQQRRNQRQEVSDEGCGRRGHFLRRTGGYDGR